MRKNEVMALDSNWLADAEITRLCSEWSFNSNTETGISIVTQNGSVYDSSAYDCLKVGISRALADDSVRGIMLCINSPGGSVQGLTECAKFIREASTKKPICVHTTGLACSAAYLLARAGNGFYASESSEIGCCGVMAEVYVPGDNPITKIFRSKNAEMKNVSPATKEGSAELQAKLDAYEDMYFDTLASLIGGTREECIEASGHGATFLVRDALDRKMCDGILTFEECLAQFEASCKPKEENMDYKTMSAEEQNSALEALLTANPDLLARKIEEIEAKERSRVSALNEMRDEVTASIIDSAIAEGKSASDISANVINAYKMANAELKAKVDSFKPIEQVAENTQTVVVEAKNEETEVDKYLAAAKSINAAYKE